MKRQLALTAMVALCIGMLIAKTPQVRQKAVFHVEITCQNCIRNIEKHVRFEEGLKDMVINQKAQTVTLTWDPAKTDTTTLKQAFAKAHKVVKRIELIETKQK